jgi:hypothetical protein
MRKTAEGAGLPALSAKLDQIRKILTEMGPEERVHLGGSPDLVEDTFGSVRPRISAEAKALADAYLSTKRPFPPHGLAAVVQDSAAQIEEARKLQAGMLRDGGELARKAELLKTRGKRIDPFPAPDPEPASKREE